MKASMLGYVLCFYIVIQLAAVCCLFSKSIYKDEVQTSLDDSIELAISLLQKDADVRIVGGEEYSTDNSNFHTSDEDSLNSMENNFINILTSNLSGKVTNVEVNFYGSDENAKLLSVEVIADFRYLDGSTGTVSSYKTMIIDKVKNN